MNTGLVGSCGTKFAWDSLRTLRNGLCGVKTRTAPAKMQKADGSRATSPEENATVFADFFHSSRGSTSTPRASTRR